MRKEIINAIASYNFEKEILNFELRNSDYLITSSNSQKKGKRLLSSVMKQINTNKEALANIGKAYEECCSVIDSFMLNTRTDSKVAQYEKELINLNDAYDSILKKYSKVNDNLRALVETIKETIDAEPNM